MSKKRYLTILLVVCTHTLFAQYSRVSVDAFAGIPLNLTFFSPTVAMYGGLGFRYNLIKEISFNAQISGGSMTGKNNAVNSKFSGADVNTNYSGFSNNFVQYTLGGQINLERVFHLRRLGLFARLNPYLSLGGGYIHSSVNATRLPDENGNVYIRSYDEWFQTVYAGLQFRYYLNPSLDFIVGADFNMAQTAYNDGVPLDKNSDNYMLTHAGIAYKVGARKDRQNVEWNNVVLRDRIYIPDIEKRQGQPLDQAGNYFVFHKDSITKLQVDNFKLQEENRKQAEQIARQQTEINKLQGDVNDMRTQLDTMKNRFDTIQKQIDQIRTQGGGGKTQIIYMPTPAGTQNPAPVREPAKPAGQRNPTQQPPPVKEPVRNEQPVISEPVGEPKPAKPVAPRSQPRSHTPVTPERTATTTPEVTTNELTKELNSIDGVVAPIARYNVIVGAYRGTRYAYRFRDKLRADGYNAAVFKSNINSKIYRLCAFTTDDKQEAISMMRQLRKTIDPEAWIHVYTGK
jgi:TolA-binding protein